MKINWLEEVTKRQDALLADLFRLLKIDSVRNDALATSDAPVGPGPLKALEEFMAMATEDGFETEQFGPWAGHILLGEGEQTLGILGHLDVVPVGSGWNTDPFDPQIIDGRIYARGSSDDKGPVVASYFALKLLRELGVDFEQRIQFIVGTDEESGWQDMDYYFKHAPMPDFGFSPDAVFPIINGEKGNVSAIFTVSASANDSSDLTLQSFDAGIVPNMVPQDAKAIVTGSQLESIVSQFDRFLASDTIYNGSSVLHGDELTLHLVGKAAHGSTPEKGINAATYLAQFLAQFTFNDQGVNAFVDLLSGPLHDDFKGRKLGIAHHDEVMGDLSMNVGIAKWIDGEGTINANFRYPQGTDSDTLYQQITQTVTHPLIQVTMTEAKEPHYVSGDDPLVKTLLQVYEDHTGQPGKEQVIGGGTFGRLMPRGVAYGALFPDSIDTMHQANEFLAVDDLLKATAIYADAIYRLTRKSSC